LVSRRPLQLQESRAGKENEIDKARRKDHRRALDQLTASRGSSADLRGWTLARAHARTGDAIAAYLGNDKSFDRAVAEFSERYARQNEEDHQAFVEEIRAGRLEAREYGC